MKGGGLTKFSHYEVSYAHAIDIDLDIFQA